MRSQWYGEVGRHGRLHKAWDKVRENARTSKSTEVKAEVDAFAESPATYIRSIAGQLQRGSFAFGQAKGVALPKESGGHRPIVVAPIKARIVQRAIHDVLIEVDELRPKVWTPYSFGGIPRRETKSEGLAAVPAAIEAVLRVRNEIGATHAICADISSFFTKVPKPPLVEFVRKHTADDFADLFQAAIKVELHNMAVLRDKGNLFPIHEIGVAQGNALSPLLGNLTLAEFDELMNDGDCRCIRYIDDFVILAPSAKAANSRLRKARRHLATLGMSLSEAKTSQGAIEIQTQPFVFLGIELHSGRIRPSNEAREKLREKVDSELRESLRAFRCASSKLPSRKRSVIATLARVDGIVDGWGKHYRFCNDPQVLATLDNDITLAVRGYLGEYGALRKATDDHRSRQMLGLQRLEDHADHAY